MSISAEMPWGLASSGLARTMPGSWVIAHELSVAGSHGMAAAEYPRLLQLIAAGTLDPRALVGRTVDLAQAGEELMALDRPVAAEAGIVVATVGDTGPLRDIQRGTE